MRGMENQDIIKFGHINSNLQNITYQTMPTFELKANITPSSPDSVTLVLKCYDYSSDELHDHLAGKPDSAAWAYNMDEIGLFGPLEIFFRDFYSGFDTFTAYNVTILSMSDRGDYNNAAEIGVSLRAVCLSRRCDLKQNHVLQNRHRHGQHRRESSYDGHHDTEIMEQLVVEGTVATTSHTNHPFLCKACKQAAKLAAGDSVSLMDIELAIQRACADFDTNAASHFCGSFLRFLKRHISQERLIELDDNVQTPTLEQINELCEHLNLC